MEIVIENEVPYHLQPLAYQQPELYATLPTGTLSRRVDKSGLLEIPEPEPSARSARASLGSRLHAAAERSGFLEVVPEIPDQYQSQAERHLTGAEAGTRRVSFVDQEPDKTPPDCLREKRSPTTTLSAIPDVIEAHGSSSTSSATAAQGPKGERAEAEGCERSAAEGHEERAYKPNPQGKVLHKDNIQAVHVIILSEQL